MSRDCFVPRCQVNPTPGFALVAAIFLITVLAILAIILGGITSTSAPSSVSHLRGVQAQVAADAGLRWIFENNFVGNGVKPDTDFSNNVSPTSAPFGPNYALLNNAGIWVEYTHYPPPDDKSKIDIKVTSRVPHDDPNGEASAKKVTTLLAVRDLPLRKVLYSVGAVNLSGAVNNLDDPPANPNGITGDMYSESTITLPPSGLTVTGEVVQNGGYRFKGVFQYPYWSDAGVDAEHGRGENLVGPVTWGPGTYGHAASGYTEGYVWRSGDSLTLDGGPGGGGVINIRGTLAGTVGAGTRITTIRDPVVNWYAPDKYLYDPPPYTYPYDPDLDKCPLFDVYEARFTNDASTPQPGPVITLNGVAIIQSGGVLEAGPGTTFSLHGPVGPGVHPPGGVILSSGTVDMDTSTVKVTLTYDASWNDPNASIPWYDSVEYQMVNWAEE